jgi:hypothetical protein
MCGIHGYIFCIGIITKSTDVYIQSEYTYIHCTGNITLLASSVHGAPANNIAGRHQSVDHTYVHTLYIKCSLMQAGRSRLGLWLRVVALGLWWHWQLRFRQRRQLMLWQLWHGGVLRHLRLRQLRHGSRVLL